MSHTGEFSHGLFEVVEWIAMQVKRDTKKNPRSDGTSPAKAAGLVRMEPKDLLATACAEGWGYQLIAAGMPRAIELKNYHAGSRIVEG